MISVGEFRNLMPEVLKKSCDAFNIFTYGENDMSLSFDMPQGKALHDINNINFMYDENIGLYHILFKSIMNRRSKTVMSAMNVRFSDIPKTIEANTGITLVSPQQNA